MFFKLRFIKKVMTETLKEKENNLVRLTFDQYYRKNFKYNAEEEKKLQDELTRLKGEVAFEKLKKGKKEDTAAKEKMIKMEMKGNQLLKKVKEFELLHGEIAEYDIIIPEAKDLIEKLKLVIKEPERLI